MFSTEAILVLITKLETSGAGGAIGKFSGKKSGSSNIETHDAGLTVRSVDYTGYPTNRTLSFPEPKSTKLNLESSWTGTNLT